VNAWFVDHQNVDVNKDINVQNVKIEVIHLMGDRWGMEIHQR
jgi:hypothetical protein